MNFKKFISLSVLSESYRKIKNGICKNSLIKRYITDQCFHINITLYFSLSINTLYVALNLLSFFIYRSLWFMILSVYYSALAVMRFLLADYIKKNQIGTNMFAEQKRARLCSYILLAANIILFSAVIIIPSQLKSRKYHGIVLYAISAYTFYIVINAVIAFVKYRKQGSAVITVSKIISLTAALVSMLSLETALFIQFGTDVPRITKRLIIILSGVGVNVSVLTLSLYMITDTTKKIKLLSEKTK